MLFLSVINHYLLWHYTRAFGEIFHLWLNFFWFTINFFSIPQLMRSWFSPWKRMVEERGNTWNFEDLAGYVVIGFFSRLIGFILRTIIICVGLIALAFLLVSGVAIYFFWVVAPFIIIGLFGFGITLLIA
jgi:hypothetical protein